MIRLNDFARLWSDRGRLVLDAVERVGQSGWYILGREVTAFETQFAAWWTLPFATGVANGMDAIEIALRALGLQPGEKVITTPLSAFATTLAILRIGAVPVFVDIDASGLIDLDRVEECLKSHSGTRFLVPVHLFGHCLDLDRLRELRDRYDLLIVEDCAQSHGARWNGRVCGSVGQFAATSFYPTKNLGAMGDAGALLTADAELDTKARRLRDYGQSSKYVHDVVGLNSRLDEIQAAILSSAFLPALTEWTRARQRIAAAYTAALADLPGIELVSPAAGSESVWHLFPVRVAASRRDAFQANLQQQGVASGVHYPILITDQRAVQQQGTMMIHGTLDGAAAFVTEEVSLPIHPYLEAAEVAAVIAAVQAALGASAA